MAQVGASAGPAVPAPGGNGAGPAQAGDAPEDGLPTRRLVLLACLSALFATTFTTTVLAVSMRSVAEDVGGSVAAISWSVTGSMLAMAVAMPILGRIGDIRGHRRAFLAGGTLSVLFAVASGLAWDQYSLIVVRVLASLAGAATIPSSFAILFAAFPPAERVRPAAWASSVFSASGVTGLAIGGIVIDTIGWRWLFHMQAVLAAASLLLAFWVLPPDRERVRQALDKTGALVLAATTFALTFGVNRAAAWGLRPLVIGTLAAVPLLGWLLVVVERRAALPVIPLGLLRERVILGAGTASFMLHAAHMGNFLVTPLLLEGVFGFSVTVTALLTVIRTCSISLAAPSASRLGTRFGPGRLAAAGIGAYVIALAMLAVGTRLDLLWLVLAGMMASGLAYGHGQPPLLVMATNAAPADNFGLTSSLHQTMGQIGAVVGMSLLSAMAGDSLDAGPFAAAYSAAAVLALFGTVAATATATGARRRAAAAQAGAAQARAAVPAEGCAHEPAGKPAVAPSDGASASALS